MAKKTEPPVGESTDDLNKIRREMTAMQPGPNRRLIALLTGIGVVVVAAGFLCLWSFYRYNQGRQSFNAIYGGADIENMRIFAPGDTSEIEELRKKAAGQSWLLHPGKVSAIYAEAGRKVSAASAKVDTVKHNYETLRKEFGKLKAEAAAQNLVKYAQTGWKRVQQIDQSTASPTQSGFNPDAAIQELHTGIRILEQQKNSFGAIKEYESARQAYLAIAKDLNPEEWKKVAPKIEATLRSSMARAKSAVAMAQWKRAAMGYREAANVLKKGSAEVMSARKAVRSAQARLAAAMAHADKKELAAGAASAWATILGKQAAFNAALKAFQYPEAVKTADEAIALLKKVQADITEARGRRTEMLEKLRTKYAVLVAQEKLLQRNWPTEWGEAKAQFMHIQALAQGQDYVALLEAARKLTIELDALAAKVGGISGELDKAKTAFQALYKKVVPAVLLINTPKLWHRVTSRRTDALTAEKRANLREAVAAYDDARKALTQAFDTVEKLTAEGKKLREDIARSQHDFRRGIQAFSARNRTVAKRLMLNVDTAWQTHNYRNAVNLLRKAAALLPTTRFEAVANGTVIDYTRGLIWAADGTGNGCLKGEKLDWYTAQTRVSQLTFADKRRWRLPTDDEMQSLLDVDSKVINRFFPNTHKGKGYYWTKTQATDDADHALCADFGSRTTRLCRKSDLLFTRPVFAP